MREVLRSEFGDLVPLVARLPRPSVAATSPFWLALAAVGTDWLVGGVLRSAFSGLWQTMHPSDVPQGATAIARSVTSVLGTAAAVAVARRGGLSPIVLYLRYASVLAALGVARSFAMAPQLIERGFPADLVDPWRELVGLWTFLAGVAIGLALARYIGVRRAVPTNAFLEAAGVRVAVPAIALALLGIAAPLADERFLGVSIAAVLAGSVAAGLVVAVRAQVVWRTALLLAGLATAAWAWPLGFSQVQIAIEAGHGLVEMLPVIFPLAEAALIVVAAFMFSLARAMRHALPTQPSRTS